MSKISTYPDISSPSLSDTLIGTDTANNNATKNFTISSIISLIGTGLYVPYTGAGSNVDLGVYTLTSKTLIVNGTAGNGFLGLARQSITPTAILNQTALFANVNGSLAWQNDGTYATTLETSANTNNRTYTFPDASGTVVLGSGATSLLAYWSSTNVLTSLPNGSGVLQNNGSGVLSWVTPFSNPMTTQGDTMYGGVAGAITRLALGATNYFYQAGATTPQWVDLFGTSNNFTVNQNFTLTPIAAGSLTSIAATFGSTIGSGTIRVGQYAYLTTQSTGSFQGVGLTTTDSTGTIWLGNGSVGGNNVIISLGGSTGAAATTGGTINGVKAMTTYNGVTTIDNVASSAGNSLKFRSKNTASALLDRLVIDGWATTAPVNLINSVVNIGGASIITANSTLQVSGSLALNYSGKVASYTYTTSDYCVVFSGSTAAQVFTLPTAVGIAGRVYELVNAGTVSISLATTLSETFLNVTATPTTLTLVASAAKSIRVMSTGAAWVQLN